MALHRGVCDWAEVVAEHQQPGACRFAKHAAVSDHVKKVVTGWGLKLVPVAHDKAAHTMTAVYMPEGMVNSDVSS